ncbi:MAG: hypothetical protein ACLQME_18370 [Alphaproteobacteria bacterium]
MDFLEFAAHSEWPVVAGIAIWLIRRPLGRMMDRISPTKVDAWGIKAEFEKSLDKVDLLTPAKESKSKPTLAMDEALPPSGKKSARIFTRDAAFQRKPSSNAPEIIVLQAWDRLEKYMKSIQPMLQLEQLWGRPNAMGIVERILGLTEDEAAAVMELYKLRNQVAHAKYAPVTESDAIRFQDAIDRLLTRIIESQKKAPGVENAARSSE